jgi:hypothetical protein
LIAGFCDEPIFTETTSITRFLSSERADWPTPIRRRAETMPGTRDPARGRLIPAHIAVAMAAMTVSMTSAFTRGAARVTASAPKARKLRSFVVRAEVRLPRLRCGENSAPRK